MRKSSVARDEEIARQLLALDEERVTTDPKTTKDVDWNDPSVQKYWDMKNKPKSEAQARKNMIDFNHNFVPMDLEIEKEKKKPAEFQEIEIEQIEKDTTGKRKKSLPRKRTRMELYRLVKERYSSSKPEGYDLMLWGDLHTLFEPDEESEIWMNQNEYNLISWSLCDFCGVHILLMQNGIAIHMLTEKKYPLSQEMISKMLSKRLEVDQESTQAYELLKFIRSQVKEERIVGNKSSSRVNTAKVRFHNGSVSKDQVDRGRVLLQLKISMTHSFCSRLDKKFSDTTGTRKSELKGKFCFIRETMNLNFMGKL
ncbi:hypothetical protein Tco_0610661 [Tanacetum coccineum]